MDEAWQRGRKTPALKSGAGREETDRLGVGAITSDLADLQKEVRAELRALVKDAIDTLHASLFDTSSPTRTKAALAIVSLWSNFEVIADLEKCASVLSGVNENRPITAS